MAHTHTLIWSSLRRDAELIPEEEEEDLDATDSDDSFKRSLREVVSQP